MHEIIVAKTAGFCFGVKRAVDKVYEQTEQGKKIYTYGPIIHNEEVVKDLEEKGVTVLDSKEELEALSEGSVVIRSHGVSKEICDLIDEKGLECIDATCPFVKRIHNIVQKESEDGRRIIIIGNDGHPEVEGIKGWSKTPATVIESKEEADNFRAEKDEKLCIVSQTTFNYKKFQELVEIFQKKGYDIIVANTICNATEEREKKKPQILKLLQEGKSTKEIAQILSAHPYRVEKTLGHCRMRSEKEISKTLHDLAHLDQQMKSGKIDKKIGFELFLIQEGKR